MILNCSFQGTIKSGDGFEESSVGGITGKPFGYYINDDIQISNCYVLADIEGKYVGGLISQFVYSSSGIIKSNNNHELAQNVIFQEY